MITGGIPIQLFRLFKASFSAPEDLTEARQLSKSKLVIYFLFLAFVMTIPFYFQLNQIVGNLKADGKDIAETIPDFSISDGKIIPGENAESYIYQTDSLVFTFEPTGKLSQEDVQSKVRSSSALLVSLLKDGMYFSIADTPMKIPYTRLNDTDQTFFTNLFLTVGSFSWGIVLLIAVLLVLLLFVASLFYNLLYTVFANLLSAISRRPLSFWDNWRIVLFASTIPTIIFAVLNSFGVFNPFQLEIKLVLTLFFYNLAVKKIPKTPLKGPSK